MHIFILDMQVFSSEKNEFFVTDIKAAQRTFFHVKMSISVEGIFDYFKEAFSRSCGLSSLLKEETSQTVISC